MDYLTKDVLEKTGTINSRSRGYVSTFNRLGVVGFLAKGDEQAVGNFEEIEKDVKKFLWENKVDFSYNGRHLVWSNKLSDSIKRTFNHQ